MYAGQVWLDYPMSTPLYTDAVKFNHRSLHVGNRQIQGKRSTSKPHAY